jgi:hypothetical protein
MFTPKPQGGNGASRSLLGARGTLASAAFLAITLAGPGAASASRVAQSLPVGTSLCSGVRPSQIEAVVGYPVPAPTASSGSSSSMGLIASFTTCLYAHATSIATIQREVGLNYVILSRAPAKETALAFIKAALKKAEQSKGSKWSYTLDNHFGMTNLYATATSTTDGFSFTVTFDVAWSGKKVAEAFVFSSISKVKIYALERLAIDNFGM